MKINLGTLKALESTFTTLRQAKKIGAVTKWNIKQIIRPFDEALNDLEKTRVELVHKYGQEDKETGAVNVLPENLEKFRDEMAELLKQEVELPEIKFAVTEFEGVEIDADAFDLLEPFISK